MLSSPKGICCAQSDLATSHARSIIWGPLTPHLSFPSRTTYCSLQIPSPLPIGDRIYEGGPNGLPTGWGSFICPWRISENSVWESLKTHRYTACVCVLINLLSIKPILSVKFKLILVHSLSAFQCSSHHFPVLRAT